MNSLDANIRDNSTKGQLNAIRHNGKVPAILRDFISPFDLVFLVFTFREFIKHRFLTHVDK